MDIHQLECFKCVVESGSILRASTILHMAQPPLSRMMKQLEQELNCQLFERGKKITLLPAGKILYDKTLSILSLKEDAIQEINSNQKEEDILKIGIVSSSTNLLYDHRLEKFHQIYPNVKLNISEANTYQLVDLLQSHIIDLAIVRTPFDTTDFHSFFFKEEPMILLSKSTSFNSTITIEDLQNTPLIIYRRFKDILTLLFKEKNITLNIQALVDDAKTAVFMASTGLGCALVPQSAYECFSHLKLHTSTIKSQSLMTSLGIIDRRGETLNPIYKAFIECLKN